ncbi:unnamed protein product [Gongylonema pulchrum]|uniref:SSD domain-containing protein n=1 Tax=Gongylonema pulchrum TaxID=637853 RepID=A0A3P7N1W9_9BILA|nr:unnamed protein product [Gongylonema pulchrum]
MVLAVGVDAAFLLLHEWFTSAELDPSSRLNSVLVEIGPSVTLTSFTNICAFMVGSFLSPYAIREFCYCSALALTLDWIFQFLVFSPILLKFHFCSFNVPEKSNEMIILLSFLVSYWTYSFYFVFRMNENFTPQKTIQSSSFLTHSLPALEEVSSLNPFSFHAFFATV